MEAGTRDELIPGKKRSRHSDGQGEEDLSGTRSKQALTAGCFSANLLKTKHLRTDLRL